MNPTVKAVLLNERLAVLAALSAREGTVSDLMVQLNAVENDMRRLRHRLVDLEAYLVGHRVELPEESDAVDAGAPVVGEPLRDARGLPDCKPLGDFVRPRSGKRRATAEATSRRVEAV